MTRPQTYTDAESVESGIATNVQQQSSNLTGTSVTTNIQPQQGSTVIGAPHKRTASLRKTVVMDCAHQLPNHWGKCNRLHGHTYTVTVEVFGEIGSNGMVLDFYFLKGAIETAFLNKCDHYYLNEVYPDMLTTAENLANKWRDEIREVLGREFHVVRIEVQEGSGGTAISH